MFVNVSVWDETVICGNCGLVASLDSNTANTLCMSGKFNDISSSWTLVPYTLLNVNPSSNVVNVVPAPAPANLERLIIILLHLLIVLSLDVSLFLLHNAVKVAVPALLNPVMVNVVFAALNDVCASLIVSLCPFWYTKL